MKKQTNKQSQTTAQAVHVATAYTTKAKFLTPVLIQDKNLSYITSNDYDMFVTPKGIAIRVSTTQAVVVPFSNIVYYVEEM